MFKEAYPIILSPDDDGYEVYSPDFDIYTQGSNIAEAIYMARDAISLVGVTLQDQGKDLPLPSDVSKIECKKDAITTFVDVDFDKYVFNEEQNILNFSKYFSEFWNMVNRKLLIKYPQKKVEIKDNI